MTQDEQVAEMGRMTLAHSENDKLIACIRSRLDTVADALPRFLGNPDDAGAYDALISVGDRVSMDATELARRLKERERFRAFFEAQGVRLG